MKFIEKCSSAIKSDKTPIVAFTLFAIYMLIFRNNYLLRWCDEMCLFDSSSTFLDSSLHRPGGILQYVGTYLTQLFYYPSLGSCVIIALWLVMAAVSVKAFRFSEKSWGLALIAPLIMLASIVQLDEAWLTMYTPGYIFAQSIGLLISIALFAAYRLIKPWWGRCIATVIIVALYPLLGFYSLLAWAMTAVYELATIFRNKRYICLVTVLLGFVTCIVVPQLYYNNFPGTTVDDQNLWLLGLPNLMYESYDLYLWMPFIVSSLLVILFAVGAASDRRRRHAKTFAWIGLVLASVWVINADMRKTENFHAQVLMNYYLERQRWNKVVGIMLGIKANHPTRSELLLCAVATAKMGYEPITDVDIEEAPGEYNPRKNENFVMTALAVIPVEFLKGNAAKSYRWSMEHTSKYGKRAFFYKYLMKSALIAGDYKLAQKYNDVLSHTMFHSRWAQEYQKYIDNPALMKDNPEFNPGDLADPNDKDGDFVSRETFI